MLLIDLHGDAMTYVMGLQLREADETAVHLHSRQIFFPVSGARVLPTARRPQLDQNSGGQLHALRLIGDGFLVRPSCRRHAPAEVDERLFRNVDPEGADRVGSDGFAWVR